MRTKEIKRYAESIISMSTDYVLDSYDEGLYLTTLGLMHKKMITNNERISSKIILTISKNEVFVFGSNEAGRHGGGAAKTAKQWGAKYGNPEGLQGKTYAIPTKDKSVKNTLTIPQIEVYVDRFIEFAKDNEDLKFLVTDIGCGLAGLKHEDVGPLFQEAKDVENIYLPESFLDYID